MKINFYKTFKNRLLEEEKVSAVDNESDMEKILKNSKKITYVLTKLLTTQNSYNEEAKAQIRDMVSDIKCISYKPTTFRIVISNSNFFDLKYDPTPLELKHPEDFEPSDSFVVIVSGKKYNIANRSEFEQCLDNINNVLKSNPITKSTEEIPSEDQNTEEQPPEEETDTTEEEPTK